MKVIFDRSTFHRERFDLLKGSRLLPLVQERKIVVFHTSTFLDETLRTAASTKLGAKDEFRRLWPFLTAICNGGWFKPLLLGQPPALKSVCDEELSASNRDKISPLVPTNHRNSVERKVTQLIESSAPIPELEAARPVYERNYAVKEENKKFREGLRKDPSEPKNDTFPEYYRSCIVEAGRRFIYLGAQLDQLDIILAPLDQPEVKFEAWKRDPTKFPHFTAFLSFFLFSLYDAERNQNSSLDPNWQPDAEQLCFLIDVDVIVSSESGFMKRAFEACWQPSDKRMLCPGEFVDELSRIQ